MRPEARQRGFTLIEVMLALVIVATAVPALLLTLDQQIDGTAHIRDRSLAQIIAANRLAELRLAQRADSVEGLRGELRGSEDVLKIQVHTDLRHLRRGKIGVQEGQDYNHSDARNLE